MTRKVLRITASNTAEVLDLDSPEGSLKVLQNAVGGRVEFVEVSPSVQMVVDEEFLYSGSDLNTFASKVLTRVSQGAQNVVLGDVVFTGGLDAHRNVLGLTDAQIEMYASMAGVAVPAQV